MIFRSLWILFLIPVLLGWVMFRHLRQSSPALRFSSLNIMQGLSGGWRSRLIHLPVGLRFGAIVLFVVALAGPRTLMREAESKTEGIDIILAIDVSGSMAAEDFVINGQRVNRLDVVKNVVEKFIDKRPSDRIGLVAFAGRAYSVSPLTIDHDWVTQNLRRLSLNMIEDGTAIGSALATSVTRLEDSDAKSRIVVLLTDGVNNSGSVAPLDAAEAAAALGIKVYTIGAGSKGAVKIPAANIMGRVIYSTVRADIDEKILLAIAEKTGAQYFRATDTDSLEDIYGQIDRLEKVKIEQTGFRNYEEHFTWFLLPGLALLLLEVVLSRTWLLKIP